MAKYRSRRSLSLADAQVVGEALSELVESQDSLTPEDIVSAAADPHSRLHPYFEWDDRLAGHAHRVNQARYYLRSIEIVREDFSPPVRAFQRVEIEQPTEDPEQEPERAYRWMTVEQALASPEAWRSVCQQELARLRQCQRTLALYTEMEEALRPLQLSIEALESRLVPVIA